MARSDMGELLGYEVGLAVVSGIAGIARIAVIRVKQRYKSGLATVFCHSQMPPAHRALVHQAAAASALPAKT